MAEHFHVLPYEGGLVDQPPGALFRMEAVLRADVEQEQANSRKREALNTVQKTARDN